jgi:LuxR family transcriptional regulator, maltose regulon positive regulatory protein
MWIRVRSEAPDPVWLAESLLDALHHEGLLSHILPIAGSTDPATWHLSTLPTIEKCLAGITSPFVLVVDDAGAMAGSAWECLVESVATSLPAGAHLILSTREALPASLWRLRTRGQVIVIGPDTLAFDAGETSALLHNLGVTLPAGEMRQLREDAGGWPVAVYLAAQSMANGSSTHGLSRLSQAAGLAEYIRYHIVDRIDLEDARFLRRASVLSTLEADACDRVTATTGSLPRLQRLSRENQLLAPADESGERFLMHPLLAEILSDHLRTDVEEWTVAHAAASLVAEEAGDLDGAVHHARMTANDDRLAALAWGHAANRLATGRWSDLKRWIEGIPDERLHARGQLALVAAWAAAHAGDMVRMSAFALSASGASGDDPTLALDAELLWATIGTSGLEQTGQSARAFIAGKPVDDPWQTLSHFLLGISLLEADRRDDAVAMLGEARRLSVAHQLPVMVAHCLAALADAALDVGDQARALRFIREGRELAARHTMDGIALAAPIFTTSAVGYMIEGRYADAQREAARALRLTSLMHEVAPWHAVQGRLALAQVYLGLGDPQRARLLLDEAGEALGPDSDSPRLRRLHAQTLDRLAYVSTASIGPSALTTAELRVVQYLPTHLSFPQIAEELFLSRHTIKAQAMSAYRKLGAHTRSEAIVLARKAGLLPRA